MTFWERLIQGSIATGQEPPTPVEIARLLQIQRSAVTKYVNGNFPKKKNLIKIALRYNLNADWLYSGQGDMVAEETLDENRRDHPRD